MRALVVVEHDNENIKSATLHAVTAASQCADNVDLLVVGSSAEAVVRAAASTDCVSRVIFASAEYLGDACAEIVAEQVIELASDYSHIVVAATSFGKSIAPRIAARLDVGQVSEVIKIHGADTFDRPIYAGNAIATVQALDPVKVITVRTTAFEAVSSSGGAGEVSQIPPVADNERSSVLGREIAKSDRPELTSAKIVVSGGRGLAGAEKFAELLTPLADKLAAALGASRAAVDAGYAPNDWQVGQTGKIVAPELYIAVGISGAIQHVAGMKDAKVIVAINKDPDAPIFQIADYGLEADLFAAVPDLIQSI